MKGKPWAYGLSFAALLLFIAAGLAAMRATPSHASGNRLALNGRVATPEELARAEAEWAQTGHADTYDNGLGADTTCARCKSPFNWDPSQELAAQAALDCGSCKRVPGASRPTLAEGVPVPAAEWRDIACAVCHVPVGDSFETGISYWNQRLQLYEPVESPSELCARCHESQHGFEVVEEQAHSEAHRGWDCTICHGAHGLPSDCTDCHDPTRGAGASEHARHPGVNCTGCHDNGGLTVWQDPDPDSDHAGTIITRRFAHTLTSWPSHNLTLEVDCIRCHHPLTQRGASVVPTVACDACHEHEDGAVSLWCIYFPRDPNPNAMEADSAPHP